LGWFLIAAQTTTLEMIWGIVQVAFGLGMVIFIHELGHFLVAKACGVKCEKFFIGFDVGGYKISRQWGETEYGVGIVPLGGYVKMLGQDDNPANAAKEMERARIAKKELAERDAAGTSTAEDHQRVVSAPTHHGGPPELMIKASAEASDEDGEEEYVLDPRSYLAKSVPQRMAIISAGVVMNIIFAWVCATMAYSMGVKYMPCVVSAVVPGSPAWRANLQLGDEIIRIGDETKPRFRDLKTDVSLGDMENGIPFVIRRHGVEDPIEVTIVPDQSTGLPTIGITSPVSLTLHDDPPVALGSPAAEAKPALEGGDTIVGANGREITDYRGLAQVLARNPDKPLVLEVRRGESKLEVTVPTNPMKRLGLVMQMGPVTDIQEGSPAAAAGLQKDDFIKLIDGGPVGDPMTLAERLRQKAAAGETVVLSIERKSDQGPPEPIEMAIKLRDPSWFESSGFSERPMSAPALGICYRVLNRVDSVLPEGLAEKEDDRIFQNDQIESIEWVLNDDASDRMKEAFEKGIELGDKNPNWPAFMAALQRVPPDTQVKLKVKAGDKVREVVLTPYASTEWFVPERGLQLAPLQYVRVAENFGEAMALGAEETKDMLLLVYRFLQKLGSQIPLTALGGPGAIAQGAWYSALDGFPSLLIFLTMLSANLAVVNFLPIPLLDGGHMVFLFLEAVLRRPVSEKIVVAFHTVGFVFIISLMLFVIALDIGIIPRGF
jgi:regulator of sigma E protease